MKGGFVSKFADDTKLARVIDTQEDSMELQTELDNLTQWSRSWTMSFNEQKCKVMHFGRNNPQTKYRLNGHELEESTVEKDVGIMIHKSLKPADQCAYAAKKANQMLGVLKRSFKYRDTVIWPRLYKAFVRPKLEFSAPAWRKQDKKMLERVQKRAINCITGLKGMTYEDKLYELNLTTLEQRRERGDALQVFKIIKGIDDIGKHTYFDLVDADPNKTLTRQNADRLNIKREKFNTEIGRHRFSMRVSGLWNKIPAFIKDSRDVNQFKNRYDLHMREQETIKRAEQTGIDFGPQGVP